jgi:antitoxin FitA
MPRFVNLRQYDPGAWRMSSCAISDCNAIIAIMASLTVRNLEENTKRKLKIRAAQHGRSMEQEVREILKSALREKPQEKAKTGADLAERIRAIWEPLGGVDLELPPREPVRDPEWLKDWK